MTLGVACLLKLVIWDPCYKTKVGGRLKRSWFYRLANRRSVKQGLFSLQCRRILGGRKLVHVRIATMKPPSLIFWQRKIGESRNSNPGILTTTFREGFMYTIFMPSLGKSSIFNRCSISSSLFDTVDGMWFSVKERDFLDLPFADVELSIEGDFAAGELTRTVLDFLHAGLALSGVSRVRLLLLTGVLSVDVIAGLINWYSWPKLRIFRPHGLQTRSEYCLESCTNGKPTSCKFRPTQPRRAPFVLMAWIDILMKNGLVLQDCFQI